MEYRKQKAHPYLRDGLFSAVPPWLPTHVKASHDDPGYNVATVCAYSPKLSGRGSGVYVTRVVGPFSPTTTSLDHRAGDSLLHSQRYRVRL